MLTGIGSLANLHCMRNLCYTGFMKKKIRMNTKHARIILWTIGVLLLAGCAWRDGKTPSADVETAGQGDAFPAASMRGYDSADTAIVLRYDTAEKTISLRNMETGRQYTLAYDGTTGLEDKNGQAITMAQVRLGELVDVTFLHKSKALVSLRQSSEAFLYDGQTDYVLSGTGRSMTVNGVKYKLADDLAVISDGALIELSDVNSVDALTLRGFDYEIHSICVERGHGYLRLKNDESFIGGWIEVGSKMIVPITENMLLTVPEGSYDVAVSSDMGRGTMPVTIYKNQEQTIDIGDFVVEIKEGKVYFDVTPANATVYVDGKKVDISEAVTLTYGVHLLRVRAAGYKELTKYLRVGQDSASLTLELEKDPSGNGNNNDNQGGSGNSDQSGSGNANQGSSQPSVSQGDSATGQTSGTGEPDVVMPTDGSAFYVSVTAPAGVEVYVDGVYVGIAPVRFKKTAGSHEISLRRQGYQTRSYMIELDNEKKDVVYSFSELSGL